MTLLERSQKKIGFLFFYTAIFLIINSFFCCAEEEVVIDNTEKEDIPEEEVSEEKGLFDFRDPFLSGLPKKVETKIVSISAPAGTTTYEPVEMEADEFDYSSLTVTGLLWGGDKPRAIINGDIVGIGSMINGATILQIDATGILFEYNDKQYLLQRTNV